jgi:hypothetical protein
MKKLKLKTKQKFNVSVNSIREDFEKKINDKIKEMKNNSNLSDYEKREAILKQENSSTYNSNNKNSFEIKFDIEKVRKEFEISIEKKCNKINDNNISDYEKRALVLKSEKTTTEHIGNNNLNINENESNIIISEQKDEHEERKEEEALNSITERSISDKPTVDTLSEVEEDSFDNSISTIIQEKTNPNFNSFINKEIKKFNPAKQKYLLQYKLYDNLLIHFNNLQPEQYKLDHNKYVFVYPNEIKTYCITISERLNKEEEAKDQKDLIQDINYFKSLGLYFCGKLIEELKMKCAPNEFMCKECMKINKEKYNLKENYLINMNGRVAKMKKESYLCFGLFVGKKESDFIICGVKFTCKSCNLLNKYSKYYSS